VPPLRGLIIFPLDRGLTPAANTNVAASRLGRVLFERFIHRKIAFAVATQSLKAELLVARIGAAEAAPFQGGYSDSEIALRREITGDVEDELRQVRSEGIDEALIDVAGHDRHVRGDRAIQRIERGNTWLVPAVRPQGEVAQRY